MKEVKVFVINLETEIERKKRISSHLHELRINFSIFKGIKWDQIPNDLHSYFFDDDGHQHNSMLTLGEIGCYDSHLNLFKQLIGENEETSYFILEDDAILDPRTKNILKAIQKTYHIYKFDFLNFRHLKRSCPIKKTPLYGYKDLFLSIPWIPSLSGVSYIITRTGAENYFRYLNEVMKRKIIYPFDVDFRNAFFEGYLNIWEVIGYSLKRQKLHSSIDKESHGQKRVRHTQKRDIIFKAIKRHGLISSYNVAPFLFHSYKNKIRYRLTNNRE